MIPDRDLIVAAWPRDLATIAFLGPSGGRLRLFDTRIQASTVYQPLLVRDMPKDCHGLIDVAYLTAVA